MTLRSNGSFWEVGTLPLDFGSNLFFLNFFEPFFCFAYLPTEKINSALCYAREHALPAPISGHNHA